MQRTVPLRLVRPVDVELGLHAASEQLDLALLDYDALLDVQDLRSTARDDVHGMRDQVERVLNAAGTPQRRRVQSHPECPVAELPGLSRHLHRTLKQALIEVVSY